jgi:hypothetical protein
MQQLGHPFMVVRDIGTRRSVDTITRNTAAIDRSHKNRRHKNRRRR